VLAVSETLVELAADLPASALARAFHQANVLHRTAPLEIAAVLDRRPNSPGARKVRRAIYGDERVTLSTLESRFLALLRANHLPLPLTNIRFGRRRLDCHWPELRLVVELDSYRFHSSRHAWEEDRRRERLLRARGDELRRYTWGDVCEAPALMLRELRALLAPLS
jgi:very-short-patch-repair endonuclease